MSELTAPISESAANAGRRALLPRGAVNAVRRQLSSPWIVVVLSAMIVLLAGSRLVVLGMQQHVVQARAAAQSLADRAAQSLAVQLRALYTLAAQRAAGGAAQRHAFWLTAEGTVVGAEASDQSAANDIAAEWKALSLGERAAVLGPIREASQWLVAVRAPVSGNSAVAWSVVYRSLDSLLLGARLDQATRAGYDFELARFDSDRRAIEVTGSADAALSRPVTSRIALPAGLVASDAPSAAPAASLWQLAIAPRTGWFPANDLVVDVSLLILVTWLVALGVRDMTRHLAQLRSALAVSRRRLQNAQHRLADEIELRQSLQTRFEHAHHHDSVTGLPNRHYLIDRLDRALRAMRTRGAQHIGLLLISVDRYKVITDTVGHTAGDELMVQITRLFDQAVSGREHVLARWAEDELALLLADVDDTRSLLDTAGTLQQTLKSPIELRRHRVAAATNMGATLVESGLQRAEEVLREADLALSRAKLKGGSSVVTYSNEMREQLLRVVSLEADLHSALERDEFRLLFQPIIDLKDKRVVGVEVLLRWLHPVEGLLAPSRFLGLAEETGLIVPITRWIILRACQLSGEWRPRIPAVCDLYLSINLSPAALLDAGLTDYVWQVLRDTGTAPAALKFELTENGLVNNVAAARQVLDRLHAMGIELMLDDFGTGYSSLSHLQLFPFDYIKLDGPMDGRLSVEQNNGALVRAMAQMASTLGLRTIAEIVETASAAKALEEIGCQFAQGNAFSAPLDAEHLLRCLRTPVIEASDMRGVVEEQNDSATMILPMLPDPALPALEIS